MIRKEITLLFESFRKLDDSIKNNYITFITNIARTEATNKKNIIYDI